MFKRIKSNINVRNEKYGNRSEEFLWRAYRLTGYEREKKICELVSLNIGQ